MATPKTAQRNNIQDEFPNLNSLLKNKFHLTTFLSRGACCKLDSSLDRFTEFDLASCERDLRPADQSHDNFLSAILNIALYWKLI